MLRKNNSKFTKRVLILAIVIFLTLKISDLIIGVLFIKKYLYIASPNYKVATYQLAEPHEHKLVYPINKPKDSFRIVILGDSFAYGYGLQKNEMNMAQLLEDALNKESNKIFEVINLSKLGNGPKEYREAYLEIARRLKPDLVIISFFIGNDIINVNDPYLKGPFLILNNIRKILEALFPNVYELKQFGYNNSMFRYAKNYKNIATGTVAKCLTTVIPRFIRGIQKHFTDEPRWLLDCPDKPGNDKIGISQQSPTLKNDVKSTLGAYVLSEQQMILAGFREGIPPCEIRKHLNNYDQKLIALGKEEKENYFVIRSAILHPQIIEDTILLKSNTMTQSFLKTKEVLNNLINYIHKDKVKIVLLAIPISIQIDKKYWDYYHDKGFNVSDNLLRESNINMELKKICDNKAVIFLDMLPVFKKYNDEQLYFNNWDCHITYLGHKRISQELTKTVKDLLKLD